MREALDGNGFDEGIRQNDLLAMNCGRVALKGGFNVRPQDFADFRN
jgi:hypothetical protein